MSESNSIQHQDGLTSGDFTAADEPLRLFSAWFSDATKSEPADPSAMTLATVDADGLPNARMVLLKGFDEQGFVFYTNLDSPKGRELGATPKGAMVFHWKSLSRQVRLRGPLERVADHVADTYFATRPRLNTSRSGIAVPLLNGLPQESVRLSSFEFSEWRCKPGRTAIVGEASDLLTAKMVPAPRCT